MINEYQASFQRGDFLVRNVIGADDSGAIQITDLVRVGQTVQFHVRDAETADEDLRSLLDSSMPRDTAPPVPCSSPATVAAPVFLAGHHDVSDPRNLGPIPVAGFFAMGEIGPIGGQNFVHGFTASVLLFEQPA